ncbi:MAG: LytTR family transcriptional regulator DNA-binding domain-containing protein [Bacteroidaceae bacterium]|nr:LytTR family transcriptional regulator DNA-binding domain-containing protein [Bacteroidaceae bacterium]
MKIIIESRDELRVIDLADVLYLHASHNYTDFHFADGRQKSVLLNLSALEEQIAAAAEAAQRRNPFLRVGRSLLVNTDLVELVSVKLNKIAFRTAPPIYLEATRQVLMRLKAAMSAAGGEA